MAKKKSLPTDKTVKELREWGLAKYPGAHLKSPWPGHMDLAVKDKTFAYPSVEGEPLGISCKLPHSNAVALMLPFTEPTGYGLGKSGWVTCKFAPGDEIPFELLQEWLDESYRAIASQKLVLLLNARQAGDPDPVVAKPKRGPKVKGKGKAKK